MIEEKVIWSEGLFLKPQHLQQQDRHFEAFIQGRVIGRFFDYGFWNLDIDKNRLIEGKVIIRKCSGIFPDGTPFDWPGPDQPTDLVLDIERGTSNTMVYLAIPLRVAGIPEYADSRDTPARHVRMEKKVQNNAVSTVIELADIEVGQYQLRLLPEQHDRSAYSCLGVVRIADTGLSDGRKLILDTRYIPPALNCFGTGSLSDLLVECISIMKNRADAMADLVIGNAGMEVAHATHILALQCINRHTPLFRHWLATRMLHPETFYAGLLQLIGELSTFYKIPARRPVDLPPYDHHDLQVCFSIAMVELKKLLSVELDRRAFRIRLERTHDKVLMSDKIDEHLLESYAIVVAVKTEGNTQLREPRSQLRIVPNEPKILKQLIQNALPGIPLEPLAAAPQFVPFQPGFSWFKIDKTSGLWKYMSAADNRVWIQATVALQVNDIQLVQLWATTEN